VHGRRCPKARSPVSIHSARAAFSVGDARRFPRGQHLVEFGAVKVRPFTMTPESSACWQCLREDCGKQHKVRELSFFHVPSWFPFRKACGIDRGGLQRFERSESAATNAAIPREGCSWENINTGGRICSRKNGTPVLCNIPTTSSSSREISFESQIVRAIALRDSSVNRFQVLVFPRCRHIFRARVFAEITRIDQIAPRSTPASGIARLILRQNRSQ